MKPKHTPGPWVINPTPYPNGDLDVNAFDGEQIIGVHQYSSLARIESHTLNHGDWRERPAEEVRANALLIAAAPRMHAALLGVIDKLKFASVEPLIDAALLDCLAAIAQAEGRS